MDLGPQPNDFGFFVQLSALSCPLVPSKFVWDLLHSFEGALV